MWQRFNESARKIVFWAQEEASRQGASVAAPEHLLLVLLRDKDSEAVEILSNLGYKFGNAANRLAVPIQPAESTENPGEIECSVAFKRVIDLAFDEARRLSHDFIGSQHLLLGLVRYRDDSGNRLPITEEWDLNQLRGEAARLTPLSDIMPQVPPHVTQLAASLAGDRDMSPSLRAIIDDLAAWLDGWASVDVASFLFMRIMASAEADGGPHSTLLESLGVDLGELASALGDIEAPLMPEPPSIALDRILERAGLVARDLGRKQTDCSHVLIACAEEAEKSRAEFFGVLQHFGITSEILLAGVSAAADHLERDRGRPEMPIFEIAVRVSGNVALDPSASLALWFALTSAQSKQRSSVSDLDLLKALVLVKDGPALKALVDAGLDSERLMSSLGVEQTDPRRFAPAVPLTCPLTGTRPESGLHALSIQSHAVLAAARKLSAENDRDAVLPRDILVALMTSGGPLVGLFFETIGLDPILTLGMLDELAEHATTFEDTVDDSLNEDMAGS